MTGQQTQAGDLCSRSVAVAYPALTIDAAARVMREQHVGCLVVVEETAEDVRRVVGMLTDRDIVTGVVATQVDPETCSVGDLMSRDVVSARETDSVLDVLALMRAKGVRRVPVVGPRNRLVGLLAVDDVLAAIAQQLQALAAAVSAAQRHERVAGA